MRRLKAILYGTLVVMLLALLTPEHVFYEKLLILTAVGMGALLYLETKDD